MKTAKQIGFLKIVHRKSNRNAVEENVYLMLEIAVKNNDERLAVLISPISMKKPFPHVFTINSISIAIGFQLLLNRCCLQFIRVWCKTDNYRQHLHNIYSFQLAHFCGLYIYLYIER